MKKRMQKHVLSFAATLMLLLGGGMQLYAADRIADTVYRNGKIYTITETAQEAKDQIGRASCRERVYVLV